MRTEIIEKTVYTFDELSDRAKEKAREWWRSGALDHEWWDCTYEDAVQCAAILGIEIAQKEPRAVASIAPRDVRYNRPAIYFTGFWSQGDGACFEGRYAYAKGAAKVIRKHAPEDKVLHRIADELQKVQRRNFYRLTATAKHRGHYYHEMCMAVDVDMKGETNPDNWNDSVETVTECLRDFARWIYSQLERESEFILSDENTDESIRINEYEFTEDGNRA